LWLIRVVWQLMPFFACCSQGAPRP
jgi:hypothetical protein